MDYATKAILIATGSISVFLLLTQFELLEGVFNGVIDIGKAICNPIIDLFGKLF